MTTPYLQGTGAVPKATALLLRGIQTDPYGEVMGGHRALIDYTTMGTSLAAGVTVPNMIVGAVAGETGAPFGATFGSIDINKGLKKSSVGNIGINLGNAFDLATYALGDNVVISAWITHETVNLANAGFFGDADDIGSVCSWALYGTGNGSIRFNIRGTTRDVANVVTGVPKLFTLRFAVGSVTGYTGDLWIDADHVAHAANPNVRPATVGGPRFGKLTGFPETYKGTLHRAQALQVDPDTFDIDTWIAAEIAANATRWT